MEELVAGGVVVYRIRGDDNGLSKAEVIELSSVERAQRSSPYEIAGEHNAAYAASCARTC